MKKGFRKFKFISCSLIVLSLMMISSCESNTGTFYALNILYDNGLITEDNLKNIAALRSGSLQVVVGINDDFSYQLQTVDYEATPVSGELTNDVEKQISNAFKTSYNNTFKEIGSSARVNTSEIIAYYGTYDEFHVVEIKYSMSGMDLSSDVYDSFVVEPYYFGELAQDCSLLAWTPNSL